MEPFWTNGVATLHHADARDMPIADKSVHCVCDVATVSCTGGKARL